MERSDQEQRCNVIYHCTTAESDLTALYHSHAPPTTLEDAAHATAKDNETSWRLIFHNVRALLDQDRGGFNEVFICTSEQSCLERLDVYANSRPTVVLVEVTESDLQSEESPHSKQQRNGSAVLRVLKSRIQGARYQKEVLPFALLVRAEESHALEDLRAETTAEFLRAGAGDIVASPISARGINHLVGHVMERTRPSARLIGSSMAQNLVNSIREQTASSQPSHRPDQLLSKDRLEFVEKAVREWAFPAHELDMDELTYAAVLMLEHILQVDEMVEFRMARGDLMAFILATRRQYKHEREVHYHNWRHAVDVTQSVYQFLCLLGVCPPADPANASREDRSSVEMLFVPMDALMLLVSAIGHDVGHPGVNNAFLVACNHPLAQLYNDKSVLENYHCAAYTQLLRRHWPSLYSHPPFRQTLISNILATDMQRHFEYMGHLTELRQKLLESEMDVDEWSDKDRESARELLMALMMKAADISNIARSFDISAKWAVILINEFASQGELEAELSIPTCLFGGPPNKEDVLAAAQSQKGFMNLFGFPLFQGLSDIMPSISCAVETLERNQRKWDLRIASETERQRTIDAGHATFASLGSEHDEDVLNRHRQSEPSLLPTSADAPPSPPLQWQRGQHRSGSPVKHPATDERKRFISGYSSKDDKRASAPTIGPGSLLVATGNAASRRSSKDVALDQLQHLSMFAHQTQLPGSRKGSQDFGHYQSRGSYPGSRRGSKDESLTTILVTSQGNAGAASEGRNRTASRSPQRNAKKQLNTATTAQESVSTSRIHASDSVSTTNPGSDHYSHSKQPSAVTPIDNDDGDEAESPAAGMLGSSQGTSDDPFLLPSASSRSDDALASAPDPLSTTSLVAPSEKDSSSQRVLSAVGTSDGTTESRANDNGVVTTPRGSLRETRSRSRLRSLKFWKKKKDATGSETASGATIDGAISP